MENKCESNSKNDTPLLEIRKLLSYYITEEELNAYITNIEDVSSLRTILELKFGLIAEQKHSSIYFSIQNILDGITISNINEICLVLRYALMIQCDESQYIALLNYIDRNLITVTDEHSLKNALKLFQVALSLSNSDMREKIFKEFIITNNFNETICNLLFTGSKFFSNFISVYILPNYLKINIPHSAYVLQAIWKNALQSKNLDILCSLPEFFLPFEVSLCSYHLVEIDEFWCILQEALNNSSSSIQKQALYLLKEAVHSIDNKDSITTASQIVIWDANSKMKIKFAFQNLIMLLEIVREKQLHLIEPSYQLLPTLRVLHSSWLICIYRILLVHPHSSVSAYAVRDILKSDWYNDKDVFKIVIRGLLSAMNKTEIADKKDIWVEFYHFSVKLDNEKFLILLQESTTITFIPPVSYQFYRNIFIQGRQIFISLCLIEQVLNNIEKLPHKFIRSGCTDLVVNFVETTFLSSAKFCFKDYITTNWILYKDTFLVGSNKLQDNFKDFIPYVEDSVKKWHDLKTLDLKEAKIILKILELPFFENDWLNENIIEPLMKRKFVAEISDRLFLILCQKGMMNSSTLCSYVETKLLNATTTDEAVIKSVLSYLFINSSKETELTNLFNKSVQVLLNIENGTGQMKLAFEIINALLMHNKCNISDIVIDDILNFWKENLLKGNKNSMHCCLSFLNVYCYKKCSIDYQESSTSEEVFEIITVFEKIIEAGNNNVIPIIFVKIKNLLNICDDVETVIYFIDVCLKKLIELRRTDIFKTANKNFIESIFFNSKILCNNKCLVDKTLSITWRLLELAASSDDVAFNLANSLYNLSIVNAEVAALFIPVIVELLLFGDILKKDQRAEYIICQQIDKDGKGIIQPNNPNFQRISIRTKAIAIVQNILSGDSLTSEDRTKRSDDFTLLLINKYKIHFNKRYFAHSYIHLQKLRVLQAFLIVHDFIYNQKQLLIDLLMNSLCLESHQSSIKFFIQWLLIKLLYNNDECLSIITSKMESTSKVHSSTIIAFVPILYHIALWRNNETFYIRLFEVFLPWTMGAHFNLRLYAQEGTKKLYEMGVEKGYLEVQQTFKSSINAIIKVLEKTERKIDIIDRFVFDAFNAKNHCNLQMIYFYIPKITNVTYDEFENISSITDFNIKIDDGIFDIENWVIQSNKLPLRSIKPQSSTNVIQKKMLPQTKSIVRDVELRKMGELIVVASLIDKTPNLGGISRTCEIFGVKQLVISTTNIINDHEFQSVSMSSENWVDILEKKVDHLRLFLLDMKEKGYSVVGAEQTSDSVKLNEFQFPKKCVLLLGNEKEGIPPNMLALIDFCVEIPQFGVVRSLNVHVAAATFIWEYTKQYL